MTGKIVPLLLILAALCWTMPQGHWAIAVKFLGLTFHPGGGNDDGNPQYPNRIDERAFWVYQTGLEVSAEYYPGQRMAGLRASTSLFKDCLGVWSGYGHLGPVLRTPQWSGADVGIGLGPTLIWRENWWGHPAVPWYHGDYFYGVQRESGPLQSAWLWYGGNIFANVAVHDHMGVQLSAIPGWPQVITFAVGPRWE